MDTKKIISKNNKNFVISEDKQKIYCWGDLIIHNNNRENTIIIQKKTIGYTYNENTFFSTILENNNGMYYELTPKLKSHSTYTIIDVDCGINHIVITIITEGKKKIFSWHTKVNIDILDKDKYLQDLDVDDNEKYNYYFGQDGRNLSNELLFPMDSFTLIDTSNIDISNVLCGNYHTVLLDTNHNIHTCGINDKGQISQKYIAKKYQNQIEDGSGITIYIRNNEYFTNNSNTNNNDIPKFEDVYHKIDEYTLNNWITEQSKWTPHKMLDNSTNAVKYDNSGGVLNINIDPQKYNTKENDPIIITTINEEKTTNAESSNYPYANYKDASYNFVKKKFNILKFMDKEESESSNNESDVSFNIFHVVLDVSDNSNSHIISFYFNKDIDITDYEKENGLISEINDWREYFNIFYECSVDGILTKINMNNFVFKCEYIKKKGYNSYTILNNDQFICKLNFENFVSDTRFTMNFFDNYKCYIEKNIDNPIKSLDGDVWESYNNNGYAILPKKTSTKEIINPPIIDNIIHYESENRMLVTFSERLQIKTIVSNELSVNDDHVGWDISSSSFKIKLSIYDDKPYRNVLKDTSFNTYFNYISDLSNISNNNKWDLTNLENIISKSFFNYIKDDQFKKYIIDISNSSYDSNKMLWVNNDIKDGAMYTSQELIDNIGVDISNNMKLSLFIDGVKINRYDKIPDRYKYVTGQDLLDYIYGTDISTNIIQELDISDNNILHDPSLNLLTDHIIERFEVKPKLNKNKWWEPRLKLKDTPITNFEILDKDNVKIENMFSGVVSNTVFYNVIDISGNNSFIYISGYDFIDEIFFPLTTEYHLFKGVKIDPSNNFAISLSEKSGMYIDDEGIVYSWGLNNKRQLGIGFINTFDYQSYINIPSQITPIHFTKINKIINKNINDDQTTIDISLNIIKRDISFSKIITNGKFSYAIDTNNELYGWGETKFIGLPREYKVDISLANIELFKGVINKDEDNYTKLFEEFFIKKTVKNSFDISYNYKIFDLSNFSFEGDDIYQTFIVNDLSESIFETNDKTSSFDISNTEISYLNILITDSNFVSKNIDSSLYLPLILISNDIDYICLSKENTVIFKKMQEENMNPVPFFIDTLLFLNKKYMLFDNAINKPLSNNTKIYIPNIYNFNNNTNIKNYHNKLIYYLIDKKYGNNDDISFNFIYKSKDISYKTDISYNLIDNSYTIMKSTILQNNTDFYLNTDLPISNQIITKEGYYDISFLNILGISNETIGLNKINNDVSNNIIFGEILYKWVTSKISDNTTYSFTNDFSMNIINNINDIPSEIIEYYLDKVSVNDLSDDILLLDDSDINKFNISYLQNNLISFLNKIKNNDNTKKIALYFDNINEINDVSLSLITTDLNSFHEDFYKTNGNDTPNVINNYDLVEIVDNDFIKKEIKKCININNKPNTRITIDSNPFNDYYYLEVNNRVTSEDDEPTHILSNDMVLKNVELEEQTTTPTTTTTTTTTTTPNTYSAFFYDFLNRFTNIHPLNEKYPQYIDSSNNYINAVFEINDLSSNTFGYDLNLLIKAINFHNSLLYFADNNGLINIRDKIELLNYIDVELIDVISDKVGYIKASSNNIINISTFKNDYTDETLNKAQTNRNYLHNVIDINKNDDDDMELLNDIYIWEKNIINYNLFKKNVPVPVANEDKPPDYYYFTSDKKLYKGKRDTTYDNSIFDKKNNNMKDPSCNFLLEIKSNKVNMGDVSSNNVSNINNIELISATINNKTFYDLKKNTLNQYILYNYNNSSNILYLYKLYFKNIANNQQSIKIIYTYRICKDIYICNNNISIQKLEYYWDIGTITKVNGGQEITNIIYKINNEHHNKKNYEALTNYSKIKGFYEYIANTNSDISNNKIAIIINDQHKQNIIENIYQTYFQQTIHDLSNVDNLFVTLNDNIEYNIDISYNEIETKIDNYTNLSDLKNIKICIKNNDVKQIIEDTSQVDIPPIVSLRDFYEIFNKELNDNSNNMPSFINTYNNIELKLIDDISNNNYIKFLYGLQFINNEPVNYITIKKKNIQNYRKLYNNWNLLQSSPNKLYSGFKHYPSENYKFYFIDGTNNLITKSEKGFSNKIFNSFININKEEWKRGCFKLKQSNNDQLILTIKNFPIIHRNDDIIEFDISGISIPSIDLNTEFYIYTDVSDSLINQTMIGSKYITRQTENNINMDMYEQDISNTKFYIQPHDYAYNSYFSSKTWLDISGGYDISSNQDMITKIQEHNNIKNNDTGGIIINNKFKEFFNPFNIYTNSNISRYNHTSIVYNKNIYIFGGRNYDGFTSTWSNLNDIWKYDTTLNIWSEVAVTVTDEDKKPLERFLHTSVLYDGKMYIQGGQTAGVVYDDLWYFDFNDSKWYKIESYSITSNSEIMKRHSHTSVVYNNHIYFCGGVEGTGGSGQGIKIKGIDIDDTNSVSVNKEWLYRYNLNTKVVESIDLSAKINDIFQQPPYFGGCYKHTAILSNNTMVIYGGKQLNYNDINKDILIDYMLYIDLNNDIDKIKINKYDITNSINAKKKYNHNAFLISPTYMLVFGLPYSDDNNDNLPKPINIDNNNNGIPEFQIINLNTQKSEKNIYYNNLLNIYNYTTSMFDGKKTLNIINNKIYIIGTYQSSNTGGDRHDYVIINANSQQQNIEINQMKKITINDISAVILDKSDGVGKDAFNTLYNYYNKSSHKNTLYDIYMDYKKIIDISINNNNINGFISKNAVNTNDIFNYNFKNINYTINDEKFLKKIFNYNNTYFDNIHVADNKQFFITMKDMFRDEFDLSILKEKYDNSINQLEIKPYYSDQFLDDFFNYLYTPINQEINKELTEYNTIKEININDNIFIEFEKTFKSLINDISNQDIDSNLNDNGLKKWKDLILQNDKIKNYLNNTKLRMIPLNWNTYGFKYWNTISCDLPHTFLKINDNNNYGFYTSTKEEEETNRKDSLNFSNTSNSIIQDKISGFLKIPNQERYQNNQDEISDIPIYQKKLANSNYPMDIFNKNTYNIFYNENNFNKNHSKWLDTNKNLTISSYHTIANYFKDKMDKTIEISGNIHPFVQLEMLDYQFDQIISREKKYYSHNSNDRYMFYDNIKKGNKKFIFGHHNIYKNNHDYTFKKQWAEIKKEKTETRIDIPLCEPYYGYVADANGDYNIILFIYFLNYDGSGIEVDLDIHIEFDSEIKLENIIKLEQLLGKLKMIKNTNEISGSETTYVFNFKNLIKDSWYKTIIKSSKPPIQIYYTYKPSPSSNNQKFKPFGYDISSSNKIKSILYYGIYDSSHNYKEFHTEHQIDLKINNKEYYTSFDLFKIYNKNKSLSQSDILLYENNLNVLLSNFFIKEHSIYIPFVCDYSNGTQIVNIDFNNSNDIYPYPKTTTTDTFYKYSPNYDEKTPTIYYCYYTKSDYNNLEKDKECNFFVPNNINDVGYSNDNSIDISINKFVYKITQNDIDICKKIGKYVKKITYDLKFYSYDDMETPNNTNQITTLKNVHKIENTNTNQKTYLYDVNYMNSVIRVSNNQLIKNPTLHEYNIQPKNNYFQISGTLYNDISGTYLLDDFYNKDDFYNFNDKHLYINNNHSITFNNWVIKKNYERKNPYFFENKYIGISNENALYLNYHNNDFIVDKRGNYDIGFGMFDYINTTNINDIIYDISSVPFYDLSNNRLLKLKILFDIYYKYQLTDISESYLDNSNNIYDQTINYLNMTYNIDENQDKKFIRRYTKKEEYKKRLSIYPNKKLWVYNYNQIIKKNETITTNKILFESYIRDNSNQLFDIMQSSYWEELLDHSEKSELFFTNEEEQKLCLSINDISLNNHYLSSALYDYSSNYYPLYNKKNNFKIIGGVINDNSLNLYFDRQLKQSNWTKIQKPEKGNITNFIIRPNSNKYIYIHGGILYSTEIQSESFTNGSIIYNPSTENVVGENVKCATFSYDGNTLFIGIEKPGVRVGVKEHYITVLKWSPQNGWDKDTTFIFKDEENDKEFFTRSTEIDNNEIKIVCSPTLKFISIWWKKNVDDYPPNIYIFEKQPDPNSNTYKQIFTSHKKLSLVDQPNNYQLFCGDIVFSHDETKLAVTARGKAAYDDYKSLYLYEINTSNISLIQYTETISSEDDSNSYSLNTNDDDDYKYYAKCENYLARIGKADNYSFTFSSDSKSLILSLNHTTARQDIDGIYIYNLDAKYKDTITLTVGHDKIKNVYDNGKRVIQSYKDYQILPLINDGNITSNAILANINNGNHYVNSISISQYIAQMGFIHEHTYLDLSDVNIELTSIKNIITNGNVEYNIITDYYVYKKIIKKKVSLNKINRNNIAIDNALEDNLKQDLIQDFVLYDNSNNLLKINNITIDSNDQKLILTMNRSVPNVLIEYSKSNTILTNVEASQESIPEKAIIQDFSLKVSNNDYYATIGEQGFNKILLLGKDLNNISSSEVIIKNAYGLEYKESLLNKSLSLATNNFMIYSTRFIFSPYDKVTISITTTTNSKTTRIECNNNIEYYNSIPLLYKRISGNNLLKYIEDNTVRWWVKIRKSVINDGFDTTYRTDHYGKVDSNEKLYDYIEPINFVYNYLDPNEYISNDDAIKEVFGDIWGKILTYSNQNNIATKHYNKQKYNYIDLRGQGNSDYDNSFNIIFDVSECYTNITYNTTNQIKKPLKLFDTILYYIKRYHRYDINKYITNINWSNSGSDYENIDDIDLTHPYAINIIEDNIHIGSNKEFIDENLFYQTKQLCEKILNDIEKINSIYQVDILNPEIYEHVDKIYNLKKENYIPDTTSELWDNLNIPDDISFCNQPLLNNYSDISFSLLTHFIDNMIIKHQLDDGEVSYDITSSKHLKTKQFVKYFGTNYSDFFTYDFSRNKWTYKYNRDITYNHTYDIEDNSGNITDNQMYFSLVDLSSIEFKFLDDSNEWLNMNLIKKNNILLPGGGIYPDISVNYWFEKNNIHTILDLKKYIQDLKNIRKNIKQNIDSIKNRKIKMYDSFLDTFKTFNNTNIKTYWSSHDIIKQKDINNINHLIHNTKYKDTILSNDIKYNFNKSFLTMDYKDVSNINWNRHYTNNINKILNDTISDISENSEIQYEGEINFHSYTIQHYISLKENLMTTSNLKGDTEKKEFNVIFTGKNEFKMDSEKAQSYGLTDDNNIYYIDGLYIQKEK